MGFPERPPSAQGESLFQVRVFRLKPGESACIKTLTPLPQGDRILGALFHHVSQSEYCPGGGPCPPGRHALPLVWHGYVAIEVWDAKQELWFPQVLEVSEHLEHQMYGQYQRGQVWELWKEVKKSKRHNPALNGVFVEQRPEKTFPQPHEVLPVLKRTFNPAAEIQLVFPNPVPLPILGKASYGDGPPQRHALQQPVGPSPEQIELHRRHREEMQRRLGRKPTAAELVQSLQPGNGVEHVNGNGKP